MNKHLIQEEQIDYFNLTKKTYHIKGVVLAGLAADTNHKNRIWIEGVEVVADEAFILRPFYESEFDWGEKAGIHSYTTALAICLYIFKEERIAENLYECFRDFYVQQFPTGNFELEIELSSFLHQFDSRLHPYLHSRFCYAALIDSREIRLYKHPLTGLISVNLAENYATHNGSVPDMEVRRLNERKQRLLFRLFAKDKTIITGVDFGEIMEQVEEVMSRFYWQSLERLVSKRIQPFLTEEELRGDFKNFNPKKHLR